MYYLTGVSNPNVISIAHNLGIGLMNSIRGTHLARYSIHQVRSYPVWAADNGCYAKGDTFNLDMWLAWLRSWQSLRSTCLFAVAPDVMGDAQATIHRSLRVLSDIRSLGYPAALVAQDGLECLPIPWDDLDVLFIGGTTAWKLSGDAAKITSQALARRKWVHMGRVNSFRRLRYAAAIGCSSVDGTLLRFGPDVKLPKLEQWMESIMRGHQIALRETRTMEA